MPRKSAAERRIEIVEAGLRVIAREGMHGASVRAIVAEAGVPLATFHYVFGSRDEMIGEAYAHSAGFVSEAPLELMPREASPEQVVRSLLDAWFERFLEHPEWELAAIEIMAYCRRTPSLAHLHQEVQERYLTVVERLLGALEARLGIVSATPARELATLVVQIADGVTYSWLRTGDTAAARRMLDAAVPMLLAAVDADGR